MRDKIYKQNEILEILKAMPRPVVFTNGVFDIIHSGHVTYLNRAKMLGGTLLVAINSDESVKTLGKDGRRPVNSLDERVKVLAGLEAVDLITVFQEQTPLQIIELYKPDIYVKGGDYSMDDLPEAKLIKKWGGECRIIDYVNGRSTTKLIEKIRAMTND